VFLAILLYMFVCHTWLLDIGLGLGLELGWDRDELNSDVESCEYCGVGKCNGAFEAHV